MKRRLPFYLLAGILLTFVALSQSSPLSLTLTSQQQFYHSSESIPITAQLLYNGTPVGNTPLTLTADTVTIINRTDARGTTLFEIPAGALRNGRHTIEVSYHGFAAQTASSISISTHSSTRTYKPTQTPSLTIRQNPFSTQDAAVLENAVGDVIDVPIEVAANGTHVTYSIPSEHYRPGKYTLRVLGSEELTFTWGVLALNFDKSSYLPSDDVLIQLAVLDDQGAIVCDADVTIEVIDPAGETTLLSTNDQTVIISDECSFLGPTQLPDYYAQYTTPEAGEYHVRVRALTYNGARELEEIFVVGAQPVIVSRNGPTRIYPLDNYHMQLEVRTTESYSGLITEVVPSSFIIAPQPGMIIVQNGNEQQLQWNVNIPAGGTQTLSYEFNPPDVSPYLHLLGPLQLGLFSEPRQWMIASDEIAAGSNADTLLMAQGCMLEAGGGCGGGATICENFASACTGTFPSSCPSDTLSCNDAAVESASLSNNNFGGVNITAYNTTITDCRSVTSVSVCYEWFTSNTQTYDFCRVGVDTTGDLSWNTTDAICPNTLQNNITCTDVTTLEGGWGCTDFFGPDSISWAYVEAKRTSGGAAHTLSIDALYFNVTYDADTTPPNASVVTPTQNSYIRGAFLINVSANESQGFVSAINATLSNNTGNATATINLTLGAGSTSTGYFNATFDSTLLRDGHYNITPHASDDFSNSVTGLNRSVIVDNTNPNATLLVPKGPFNTSGTILLNSSVNDSLSTVMSMSYYLQRPGISSSEIVATRTTGSATAGYWSATYPTTSLQDGLYNVTILALDVAGNQIFRNETNITIDNTHPNASTITPLNNTNTSQSILINASVNDSTTSIFNVSYRVINPTYVSAWMGASKNSGSDFEAYWNVTFSNLPEGRYNISVNATDYTNNQFVGNVSYFTFDTTPPNTSLLSPIAHLNTSQQFLINSSVNDSLTGVFNVSYRLTNPSYNGEWLFATKIGTLTTAFWNTTPDISILEDGHYNISINATDFAGNQNVTNLTTVTIDRVNPNATIVAPLNGSVVSQTIVINSSVNDSTSRVRHARYRLSGDLGTSLWFSAERTTGSTQSGYWTLNFNTFQLANGFYNITINTSDFAGNEHLVNISEVEIDNILDFVAPNVSVVYPYTHNVSGQIIINASVNDTDGSIFHVNATIYNNTGNVSYVSLFLTTGTTVTGFWTTIFDTTQLRDGYYNVSVNATDQNQNVNSSLNASFVVDNTAPNASITVPINGSVFADSLFLINASVNDSFTGTQTVRFRLHRPGSASAWVVANHSGSIYSGYWNVTLNSQDYENGLYNITTEVYDFAGSRVFANLTEIEIDNFIPDTTPPNVSITIPHNTNISESFLVNVSINDTGGDLPGSVILANLTVYNTTGNATSVITLTVGSGNTINGYWNATVVSQILSDGRYNLSVSALDDSGNLNISENLTIVIDNTPVNITLIEPDNLTNASSAFLINASVNDSTTGVFNVTFMLVNHLTTTTWAYADQTGTIFSGYWNASIPLTMNDGTYNITVNATDFAHNQYITNISTITIDTVIPNGSIISPQNLSNISGSVLFNLSVNDTTSGVEVAGLQLQRANAAPNEYFTTRSSGTLHSGYWNVSIDTSILTEGRYNVTINATDFAGNKLLRNHTQLTIDNTPPTATSRSPTNGSLQGSEVDINITASDPVSQVASLEVRLIGVLTGETAWFSAVLNSGTISTGSWNKTIDTNTVLDGDYNITVRITDFAGNQFIANMSNIKIVDQSTLTVSSADYCASGSCASPIDTTAQVVTDNDGQTRTLDGKNGDLVRVDVWSFSATINEDDAILGVTASCNFASSDNNFHVHYDWCDNSIAGDCSTDGSANWNTNFCQSVAQPGDTSCNLFANGVDTVDEINNLWIRCVSEDDDGSGADVGTLDFVGVDVFYQALTDLETPNVSILLPLNATNVSQLFFINASANDTRQLSTVNATLYNSTGNASTRVLSLYSGNSFEGLWNATFNTSSIADGAYTLRAAAADLKGNFNYSQNITLFIDNTPPNQTIVLPRNNSNLSQNVLVNVSLNDSITGVISADVRLGPAVLVAYRPLNRSSGSLYAGYWNYTFDVSGLADGIYNVTVQSNDFAGVSSTSNISYFTLDRAEPNGSIISPLRLNSSTDFRVNASVNDSLTGIFNVSFRLANELTSTGWMYSERYAGSIYSGSWNSTLSISGIEDGVYNVTLNATDFAGNQNLTNITTVVIDTLAANTSIITPLNNTNVTGSFLINASVNDTLSFVQNVSYLLASPSTRSSWLPAALTSGNIIAGYWTLTFDPSVLSDDRYNITINATDFAGNQNLVNISTLFIDRTAPNVTILRPVNGTNTSRDLFVNASVNDTPTGVQHVRVRLINEYAETEYFVANRSSGSELAGYWNTTISIDGLLDGIYNVSAEAVDYAGTTTRTNGSYSIIDTTPPNGSLVTPVNGNFSTDFSINVSVNDSLSSVYNATLRLARSEFTSNWIYAELNSGTTFSGYWNASVIISSIPDGVYNITLNATDTLGLQNISNISSVRIDTTAPNISTLSPLNNSNHTTIIYINSSVNDSVSGVKNVTYRIINSDTMSVWLYAQRLGTLFESSWNSSFDPSALTDGRYNITANVTDYADNELLVNVTSIIIDNTAPNASITAPINGSNLTGTALLNASVNDSTSAVYNVSFRFASPATSTQWQQATLSSGNIISGYWNSSFDTTTLPDGIYNVTVNASDFSGNLYVSNLTWVRVDNNAPNASIVTPQNANVSSDFFINTSVNDSTTEILNVSLRLSNEQTDEWQYASLTSGNEQAGYWSTTLSVSGVNDGVYNVTMNATDFAGNTNLSNITFVTIDRISPNASLAQPLNDSNLSGLVLVNFSINDSLAGAQNVQLRVLNELSSGSWESASLTSGTIGSGYWTATFDSTTRSDGYYNLSINATDFAGNVFLANISSFTIDNTAPNATIITPQNLSYATGTLLINSSVNDSSGIASVTYRIYNSTTNVSLLLNSSLGAETIYAGYWNTTFDVSELRDDYYNITINATDGAANSFVANVSIFIRDTTGPEIVLTAPANDYNTSNSSINFTWIPTDRFSSGVTCSFSIDEIINVSSIDVTNGIQTNATLNDVIAGMHSWNVTCTDVVGNSQSSETRNYTLVEAPANITAIIASDNASVTLHWSNVSYADYYAIFISSAYDSFPLVPNVTGITDLNYTDNSSSNATTRYYKVATFRGGINTTTADVVGKQQLTLEPEYNLVSFPFIQNITALTNSTYQGYDLAVVPTHCVSEIWKYNASIGFEETLRSGNGWLPAAGSENFTTLSPDEGYWLYNELSQACNLSIAGRVPTLNRSVTINQSFNLVSWHSQTSPTLPENCDPSYPFDVDPLNSLHHLFYYNASEGEFKMTTHFTSTTCPDNDWGWFPDSRSEDFTTLTPGKGYYLDANQSSIWTVDTYR